MDKEYWKKYYKHEGAPLESSLFAQFVLDNHLRGEDSLIELGCGNGRDSIFFASHGINVVAVDQCEEEIKILIEKNSLSTLNFISADFTKLKELETFNYVYSRFTLHSISEKEEDRVINWAYKNLKLGGKILIEARGKKNEFYKLGESVPGEPDAYIYENHYRRFIDIDKLISKLESVGFKIVAAEEKSGFAPSNKLNQADQKFIRVIASKK
jgi:cyclopropane fatty-acyl-phospholipid synthase-like methyltransferase